jgi:serine protease AprX
VQLSRGRSPAVDLVLGRIARRTSGAQRVWLLTGLLLVAAVALAVLELPRAAPRSLPFPVPWPAIALAFYVVETRVVHLHIGRSAHSFSMAEIPLLFGVFFLSPAEFIAARMLGGGLALVIARRQRSAKLALNLAQFLLGSTVAVAIIHIVASTSKGAQAACGRIEQPSRAARDQAPGARSRRALCCPRPRTEPRVAALNRPAGDRMSPTFGWSLDFTGASRRLAGILTAALLGTALIIPGSTFAAVSYNAAADMNSMYNTTKYTGAEAWWTAGFTGKGVDVALIDTGVNPVAGLATKGKLFYGPDLSFESQVSRLANRDTNGHGTFMAGLIAGKDSTLSTPYSNAPASAYRGMAPDARIVSVKVGVADGGVDVSQVIAAIDWVVQHRNDNGLNIRVINISYGTNSVQPYEIDPLSFAVEQAWRKGIVVVAAAGNSGFQKYSTAEGLSSPAYNPYVIAVGGSDSMGTATTADDTVGDYSANGTSCSTGCRNPDFVAPGSHIQGLRVTNSYIDLTHPEGVIDSRFFRGSGTSQAAAIVSGAVALLLQKDPLLTPDSVKHLLTSTATGLPYLSNKIQGKGEMQLANALTAVPSGRTAQDFLASTGTGSLELARGTDHVSDDGVALVGEIDIFRHAFDSSAMATLEAAGNSWSGGTWNGNTWSGSSWSGSTWSGSTWSGNSWSGNTWSGNTWSGNTWSGNTWSGNTWSGSSWSGNSWSGNSWSSGSWN